MKRIAIAAILTLSLSACGTCGGGTCYSSSGGGYHSPGNSPAQDNAAILLMGGTAFVNGYNAGQSGPLPMTNYGGHITMWSGQSGMLQGY
jgi:hypothetical protein